MSIFFQCASMDLIDVRDLGVLAGDIPVAAGIREGSYAARFLDGLRERKVLLSANESAHNVLIERAGPHAMLTRDMAARLIHATGIGRGTTAEAWARGVGRVAPPLTFRAEPGLDQALWPARFTAKVLFANTSPMLDRFFDGTAYAGGVITDHPLFDRVAFDLSSTKFKTPAPILHNHSEPVGVIESAELGSDIKIAGKLFSGSDAIAQSIVAKADSGMPWQLSVGIYPGQVDSIKAGTNIRLNGHLVSGPLAVFRNNRIRETSFVPLGADDRTSVRIGS